MDKQTRNHIQRATQAARRLLEEEYADQLEGTFDIQLDGTIAEEPGEHLEPQQRLVRQKILAVIEHHRSGGADARAAVAAYLREAAFTTLNRFVALKMLEARGLVQECVSSGDQSAGFKEFTGLAPGLGQLSDHGYRLYIETIFDELSSEIRVLFERHDPRSLLWPKRAAFDELLDILNDLSLAEVWAEDETIGWVYQYFNGDDERSQMRAESQAPRNSRELAVRNQFFTPRYVVQFLTDNTLGRTWYEMMQGDTGLADLDYLVRRPNEVFLSEGEQAPESDTDDSELSQEELLQQTVYVTFRAKKDPRDLRILDPACGSGHFLLYAFDLLITIYEEAWAHAGAAAFTETGTQLRADYESLDDLRRAMPELILRHNLHGVDIDPRAAQIAALALWMRAQRAYNQFEVDRAQRPPITKTNIVVAEPMPGDAELINEFAASLKPAVLGDLFKKMVEEMKLAGELGSLLKIEESIADSVKEASEGNRQGSLFDGRVESQDFWDTADEKIIAALGSFAESAAGAGGVRRQLFAGDAAQGVAFIELMRRRFDAVLMNPPFGKVTTTSKGRYDRDYNLFKTDIALAFVDRFAERLAVGGGVGALTSRAFLALKTLNEFRETRLAGSHPISALADLGYGVLDGAMVEAAAYILRSRESVSLSWFAGLLDSRSKAADLRGITRAGSSDLVAAHAPTAFNNPPLNVIWYWLPSKLVANLRKRPGLASTGGAARHGFQTTNDFRFYRLRWEVPIIPDRVADRFKLVAKGGEYEPFWSDYHLAVNWGQNGEELKCYLADKRMATQGSPDWGAWLNHHEFYFLPGLTYPERTTSDFCPSVLPRGVAFTASGMAIQFEDLQGALAYLAGSFTRSFKLLVDSYFGSGDSALSGTAATHYTSGTLNRVSPGATLLTDELVTYLARGCALAIWHAERAETSILYGGHTTISVRSFRQIARQWSEDRLRRILQVLEASQLADRQVAQSFGLVDDFDTLDRLVGPHPNDYPPRNLDGDPGFQRIACAPIREVVEDCVLELGARRQITKKTFFADRRVELLCHRFRSHPDTVVEALRGVDGYFELEAAQFAMDEFGRAFGVALGRWVPQTPMPSAVANSLEQVNSRDSANHLLALFDELPGAPPALRFEETTGILVDDEGHPRDLLTHIDAAITARWMEASHAILGEIANAMGASDRVRHWTRQRYFDAHVKTYSASRRKAPIYWQLATPSASYSVWCYYHRLTRDTFFQVGSDYVAPKVAHEDLKLKNLHQSTGPNPSSQQRKDIEAQESFVAELRTFLTEIERIAPLWNPNLNDGVIINFAPLWRLVPHHKPWQKECKKVWDKLVKGDYDWAHLAMHLWPERVVPKCAKDRSLAIAHGLEEAFWIENDKGKWEAREVDAARVEALIEERSSLAVKQALTSLLSAPAPGGSRKKRRARK